MLRSNSKREWKDMDIYSWEATSLINYKYKYK